MKRGYMDPNTELLSDGLLDSRRRSLIKTFDSAGVDAAVIYGDVASADELQYFANLGPYWGSATCVLDKDGSRKMVTGMTARVNFWVSMMSRVPQDDITGAGPKVNSSLAEYLTGRYPAGAAIGLVGEYFPERMKTAIEKAGFRTVWMEDTAESLLDLRDDAYRANLIKGIELMTAAISEAIRNAADGTRTMIGVAADVEYACRKAGAMDALFLGGEKDLVFGRAAENKSDKPWTLYMQLQYLGDWMAIARNVDAASNEQAFSVRDKVLAGLKPGTIQLYADVDGWERSVFKQLRSDHLSRDGSGSAELSPGQVVGVRLRDRKNGVMIEDAVLITDSGARLLTGGC